MKMYASSVLKLDVHVRDGFWVGFNLDDRDAHHIYFPDWGVVSIEWSMVFNQHKTSVLLHLMADTLIKREQKSMLGPTMPQPDSHPTEIIDPPHVDHLSTTFKQPQEQLALYWSTHQHFELDWQHHL